VTSWEIAWQVHVRANNAVKAELLLGRVFDAIGQVVDEHSVVQYWKIPEQYVLRFVTLLQTETVADAVFATLMLARQLGSGWLTSGPIDEDVDAWTFELVCASAAGGGFHVRGIEWADMSLRQSR
jgi:hypothetical protein